MQDTFYFPGQIIQPGGETTMPIPPQPRPLRFDFDINLPILNTLSILGWAIILTGWFDQARLEQLIGWVLFGL